MNENIDVRMSNYITILSNPELKKEFDESYLNFAKKLKDIEMSINLNYQNQIFDKCSQNESNKNNTFHTPLRKILNNSSICID